MKRLIQIFAIIAVLASGVHAETIYVTTSGIIEMLGGYRVTPPVASFQASFAIDLSLLLNTGSQTLTDYNVDITPFQGYLPTYRLR